MRHLPDPHRWRKTRGESTLDSHLGEVFAHATPPGELSSAGQARILRNLQAQSHSPRNRLRVWMPVFGALIALFFGSYAVATGSLSSWLGDKRPASQSQPIVTSPPQPSPSERKSAAPPVMAAPQTDALEEPPALAPLPPTVGKRPRVAQSQRPAKVDDRDSEVALLSRAFRALQVQGNAEAALHALDRYSDRHPKGTLAPEALATRINALVTLRRHDDALALLQAWQPRHLNERALATTRGELQARQNTCSGAVQDFDFVLETSQSDALSERALQGRAHCRAKLGNISGAREDLESYLRMFPHGRFVKETNKALSGGL